MKRFILTVVTVATLAVIATTAIQSQDDAAEKPKPVGWEYETVTSIEVRLALQEKMEKEGFDFGGDGEDEIVDLFFAEPPEETKMEFHKRIHAFHSEYLNERDKNGWEFCGSAGDHWVFRRKR